MNEILSQVDFTEFNKALSYNLPLWQDVFIYILIAVVGIALILLLAEILEKYYATRNIDPESYTPFYCFSLLFYGASLWNFFHIGSEPTAEFWTILWFILGLVVFMATKYKENGRVRHKYSYKDVKK